MLGQNSEPGRDAAAEAFRPSDLTSMHADCKSRGGGKKRGRTGRKQINNVTSPSRKNSILAVPLVPVVGKEHKLYPTQMCFRLLTTGKILLP